MREFYGIQSCEQKMFQLFQLCRNVARTESNILIRGESGTGKELIARAIHRESPRCRGPFVAINCAALTHSLVESELFGHKKGAFTGAFADRIGIFQQASGGTLFLDEVAELPLSFQAKLLRVLQERKLLPVGASREIDIDVRVVSATHRALRKEVIAGRFRQDLMFRLRVVPLFLPPLRQRHKDIPLLFRHMVSEFNKRGLRQIETVSSQLYDLLGTYLWPGNVRELRNAVEYAFAVGLGPTLLCSELPPEILTKGAEGTEGNERVSPFTANDIALGGAAMKVGQELADIRTAIADQGGHLGRAAKQLGISRATLWRRRQKFKIG